jgi:hypothetical protein
MAQSVQVLPTSTNTPLTPAAFADIPGLSITVLNGSGWIRLSYSIDLFNTVAAPNDCGFRFKIDGQPILDTLRYTTVPTSGTGSIASFHLFKPGSGQHTYNIEAFCAQASILIPDIRAAFILDEPGY